MEWIFMLCPGIISTCLTEKLKKEQFSPLSFFKHFAIFTFFINFICVLIYNYFIQTETSIVDNFIFNEFLIHYSVLALILAFVLPVLYIAFCPWFSLTLTRNTKTSEKNSELSEYTQD